MTRHEAREQAFLLLFDRSFHPEMTLEDVIALAAEDELIVTDDFALTRAADLRGTGTN